MFEPKMGSKDAPKNEAPKKPSYEGGIKRKNLDEERGKTILKTLSAVHEKFQLAKGPNTTVEQGSFVRRKKLERDIADLQAEFNNPRTTRERGNYLQSQMEMINVMLTENNEILDTKLSLMDPSDAERIRQIDEERDKTAREKSALLYVKGLELSDRVAKERDLTQQGDALYLEEGGIKDKYDGLISV